MLLTDVSDVVFQDSPFRDLPNGELLCFLEQSGRTIVDCVSNTNWVRQILGLEAFERIKNQTISCAGTIIGTHRAILTYIDTLLSRADPVLLNRFHGMRGADQGIHNFLLHTGGLPGAVAVPNGAHVLTMGFVPDDAWLPGPDGAILTALGRRCPIVHQYTYKARAAAHVNAAWPVNAQPTFFVDGISRNSA